MEKEELIVAYANWIVIVSLTIIIFSLVSKREKRISRLIPFVLIPIWIIISILQGFEHIYFGNFTGDFSFQILLLLMAETLPMIVLFAGITFFIKYRSLRKSNISNVNQNL